MKNPPEIRPRYIPKIAVVNPPEGVHCRDCGLVFANAETYADHRQVIRSEGWLTKDGDEHPARQFTACDLVAEARKRHAA